MYDGIVAHHHARSQNTGIARVGVEYAAVLDIGPGANPNGRFIAPDHCIEPYRGLVAKLDISKNHRPGGDENPLAADYFCRERREVL
mgnify:CR=1 FL=1